MPLLPLVLFAITLACATQTEGASNCTEGKDVVCSENGTCGCGVYSNAKLNVTCADDFDCLAFHDEYRCVSNSNQLQCEHKPIWPLSWRDWLLFFFVLVAAAIASGGGIGGGGLCVPLLLFVSGFETQEAIPLSTVLVGTAAITNYIQMITKAHPLTKRPLIHYDLALMIQPMSLAGTVVGVILNKIFPDWLVLVLLIVTLGITFYRLVKKGLSLWNEESKAKKDKNLSFPESDSSILCQKQLWIKTGVLFLLLAIVVLQSLMAGGKSQSIIGIMPCTPTHWVVLLIIIPVLTLWTVGTGYYLIRMEKQQNFMQGDIHWNKQNTAVIGILSSAAGILASLLGIGGGMVLSPLMLELKVLPTVTAATSSYMILFTSIATTVQFAVAGQIRWDYAVVLMVIGCISSVVGQVAVNQLIKKYDKKSYVVLFVIICIGTSAILLTIAGGIKLADQIARHAPLGFKSYC